MPVEAGRTVTDLPVRQTHYWPRDDGSPATAGPSMLMATYDDGTNIGFWDGLRPRRGQAWLSGHEVTEPADPFIGNPDIDADPEWFQYKASEGMVAEVARQPATIHGLPHAPEVRNAAFRDWGDDPFGGGWNSWNIGMRSWEVRERILQPVQGRHLYICGEAYSDAQGWVEGALQPADAVPERIPATEPSLTPGVPVNLKGPGGTCRATSPIAGAEGKGGGTDTAEKRSRRRRGLSARPPSVPARGSPAGAVPP